MKIKKIYIENFKSFGKVEIAFQPINLLIGANASGKSNLVTLFEFLKLIQARGIEEAVANMGGFSHLLNMNTDSRSFTIKVEFTCNEILTTELITEDIELLKKRTAIHYSIEASQKGNHFQIREEIIFTELFVERNQAEEEKPITSEIVYGVTNKYGKFETFNYLFSKEELSTGIVPLLEVELPFSSQMLATLNNEFKNKSILEYRGIFIPSYLFQFGIYDIQPKLAKLTNPNADIEILKKDASNLTQVVNQILKKDTETAQQFIASVGGVLDFIDNIKVDRFENLLFMRIKERYNKNWTDSSLISDGTVNVIAMIVALYYQPYQISFFEEPEQAIHPGLIELLIERLQIQVEYTEKQFFITTHSPEMLKVFYEKVGMRSILFINRSKKTNDCTEIQYLSEKENVKDFIEILGIEESFVQELIK
jgi:predicted ATPase